MAQEEGTTRLEVRSPLRSRSNMYSARNQYSRRSCNSCGIAREPERWESGSAILLEGSNKQIHAWSIALHLIINGFGSVVLGGSNYTMQCLAAPSRAEVDRAHNQGKALSIGTQSMRNVFGRISRKRSTAWWLLAISSVPIHLLYNSSIFQTIGSNSYGKESFKSVIRHYANHCGARYSGCQQQFLV